VANFTFDKVNKLVIVDAPETEVTVQEIVNAVRDWSDELQNMEVETFMFVSGKEALGGGVYVGITCVFVVWKLQFEGRAGPDWTVCKITGGNFIGTNENGEEQVPIQPSAYVTVLSQASSSATIITTSGIVGSSVWSEAEKDQIIEDVGSIETTVAGIDTNVDALGITLAGVVSSLGTIQTTLDEVHAMVSGLEVTLSGSEQLTAIYEAVTNTEQIVSGMDITIDAIDSNVVTIGTLVELLRDANWNKKVLTRINDSLYKEELYDDAGLVVIRTHRLSAVGDVETRDTW